MGRWWGVGWCVNFVRNLMKTCDSEISKPTNLPIFRPIIYASLQICQPFTLNFRLMKSLFWREKKLLEIELFRDNVKTK